MILELEIEQFIKEIEERLPNLSGDNKNNALGKLGVLNRIQDRLNDDIEFERKLMLDLNDMKCNYLKSLIEIKELKSKLEYAEEIIDKMTEEYELRY